MINNDRIVPVTKTDLITLYGLMLGLHGTSFTKQTGDIEGNFKLANSASGNLLCDAPVKTLDFGAASAAVVYFVAGYDYEEIRVNGTKVSPAGDVTIKKDCTTLYTATLSGGTVTLAVKG